MSPILIKTAVCVPAGTAYEQASPTFCSCHFCDRTVDDDTGFAFDGITMCEDCYNDRVISCDHCGRELWADDNCGDERITLCESCRELDYVSCRCCGRVIHIDDAVYLGGDDPYCDNCADDLDEEGGDSAIHDYNYKPSPLFYGEGPLFMGVELEIDKGGESGTYAARLCGIANRDGTHVYCKHDGSLDDGFEIVSHPMTLEYHRNRMNWRAIMDEAVSLGYRSHQTRTCGLHVHVSRAAFGKTYDEQEECISRVVFFVENHWNDLVRFSRRHTEQLNRWSSRYGIGRDTKDTYQKVKEGNPGRYVAVNLENDETVEFRLFRGTLRYETFLAALELVHELCTLAVTVTDEMLEAMPWSDFVRRIDPESKPELIEYLKSKYLYINEATEEECEL